MRIIIWILILLMLLVNVNAVRYHTDYGLYDNFESYGLGTFGNQSKWNVTVESAGSTLDIITGKYLNILGEASADGDAKAEGNFSYVPPTNFTILVNWKVNPISAYYHHSTEIRMGIPTNDRIAIFSGTIRFSLNNVVVCQEPIPSFANDTFYLVNLTMIDDRSILSIDGSVICDNNSLTEVPTEQFYTTLQGGWYSNATFDNLYTTYTTGTCSDGIQNGDETNIDCGGSVCNSCGFINWDDFDPQNNSINYNSSLLYYFNITGDPMDNANCSIIWNGTQKNSSYNLSIDTLYNFTVSVNPGFSENITSYINCSGEDGYFVNSTNKSVYWNLTYVYSNLSTYNGKLLNDDFDINITTTDFSSTHSCGVIINSSSGFVSCTNDSEVLISENMSIITCSLLTQGTETMLFTPYCNNSQYAVNGSSQAIKIDQVKPTITLVYPLGANSTKVANNSALKFDITASDPNLFGVNLSCYLNGVQSYSWQETNLVSTTYNLDNSTVFHTPGQYNCIFNASDDHTLEEFNAKTGMDIFNFLWNDYKGYVGDLNFAIPKSQADSVEIIQKRDRVSLKINIDNPKNELKKVNVSFECPYQTFKRNSKYKEHWICANGIGGYWIDGDTINQDNEVSSKLEGNKIIYTYLTTENYIETDSIGGVNYDFVEFNFTSDYYENITFVANNAWNGSTIPSFNVSIFNSSDTFNYSTTTGNITVSFYNGTYTVNQTALTYAFGNLSTSYTSGGTTVYNTSFWQAEATVNVRETISRALILDSSMNATVGTLSNYTISLGTGTRSYKMNAGAYNFSANASTESFNNSVDSTAGTFAVGDQVVIDLNLTRRFSVLIRREQTDTTFNFTESNTSQVEITITIICPTKEVKNVVTTASPIIEGLDCDWTAPLADKGWYVTVNYPEAGESYYRFVNPPVGSTNVTIWLMELQEPSSDTIVEEKIPLQDLANKYNNAIISVEKWITDGYKEVISQKIDFTKEVTLWLDEGERYNLYVEDDDGNKKLVDYFIAEAKTATLVLPNIAIFDETPTAQDGTNIVYIVDKDAGTINMTYTDTLSGFTNFTWEIYRLNKTGTNNWSIAVEDGDYVSTLIYNYTWTNGINISALLSGLSKNETYVTKTTINHKNATTYVMISSRVIWYRSAATTFPGFSAWDEDIKLWVAMGTILSILLLFSAMSIEYGLALSIVISWIFLNREWLDPLNHATHIGGFGRITLGLSFFSIATVIMVWRKIQKSE